MFQFFWVRAASVWIAALYVIMGILLFVFPAASSTIFIWALAAGSGAYGASHLIRWLQSWKAGQSNPGDLFLSILPAAFSVFSLIWPQSVLSILPLVLGSLFLVDGFGKLPLAIAGLREQMPIMVPLMLSSIIPISLDAAIVINPFATVQLVVMVFSASLILDGASDLVTVFLERHSSPPVQTSTEHHTA